MKRFLENIVANFKLPIALILLAVCVVFWIPAFISSWAAALPAMILCAGNAVLLMKICYKANITRMYSALPVLVYFLVFSAQGSLVTNWRVQLLALFLMLSVLLVVLVYRSDKAMKEMFLLTLLLSAASLVTPEALLMIPLFWLYMFIQQSMNIRVFLASVIAIAIFAIYYVFEMNVLETPLIIDWQALLQRHVFSAEPLLFAYVVVSLCFTVYFIVSLFSGFSRCNIYTQSYISVFSMPAVLAILLVVYCSNLLLSLAWLLTPMAALALLCFLQKKTVLNGVIFLTWLLTYLGFGIYDTVTYFIL